MVRATTTNTVNTPTYPAHTTPWHLRSVDQVLESLGASAAAGLDTAEVVRRLATYGPNSIEEARRRSTLRMLLDQFTDFMVLVLIAAAVVSGMLGEPQDTIAIVVIVVLNAALGFVQEYRAERAVAALKEMAAPTARVRRGGTVQTIVAPELVPGDIVLLEAGNVVPADLRLVEAAQLKVDESALTGESHPVEKLTGALHEPDLPLGDRINLAFKGTLVTYGRGVAVVIGTGMQTELGRVAALIQEAGDQRTPLQKRLAQFGQRLALGILAICAFIFATGVLRGEAGVLMLLTALSLAVAAIPEALPAVVSVSLALGARKMVAKHALIRRLPAVESLGSVTYICSDKTGTLTQNRMEVRAFYAGGEIHHEPPATAPTDGPWPLLFTALALCNDAERSAGSAVEGDPTEIALFNAAANAGFEKAQLQKRMPRIDEIPFSSETGRMTTVHRDGARIVAFTKGAPERVIECCSEQLTAAGREAIDTAAILRAAEQMAAEGHRVLAVAYRKLDAPHGDRPREGLHTGLTLLGLVGLLDPPRPEAREAVALCQSAGIHVVMITGDHPATARAIAHQLGIIEKSDGVITGQQFARMSEEELQQRVTDTRVYARVAPEHKIDIVRALQERGEFVAMTGDGVNDAPALRRSDVGVAMGKIGTDVAREAADMVLLDDNFATIVAAVREGRRIFDNIRKFVRYALSGNSGEIWSLFLAPFVGLPVPLLPIHILWINLVTDGLPGLALAVEPEERHLMDRPPRHPQESIFAHGLWQHTVWVGLLMGGVTLLTQAWSYTTGSAHWQSMTFTVLTLSQMSHVLAIRSDRDSLFRQGLMSNTPLLGAVLLTFILQMATLYVPVFNDVFKTQPLDWDELALCLALSSVVFFAVEIEKVLIRRGLLYGAPAREFKT